MLSSLRSARGLDAEETVNCWWYPNKLLHEQLYSIVGGAMTCAVVGVDEAGTDWGLSFQELSVVFVRRIRWCVDFVNENSRMSSV